jgi:hypothetical protein
MAYAVPTTSSDYSLTRQSYNRAVANKTRIAPHDPIAGVNAEGTGLPDIYGTIEDKNLVRQQAGFEAAKPTNGIAGQYLGQGRAMSLEEKKFYAKLKEEAGGTFRKEVTGKLAMRDRIANATIKKRVPGLGLYTARAATAEDLDKHGNLPIRSLKEQALINRFVA